MIDYVSIGKIILDIGSISGLIVLPYTVAQARKRKPKLKYEFAGTSGRSTGDIYTYEFNGTIKNQSIESNSIIKIYLVVWANKQKTSTLRYGWAGATIFEESTGKEIKLPMIIGPKEALKIKVKFILSPKGTTDERLLSEMEPLFPGSNMHLPKHNYVLCFEDVEENMFDQTGNMINIEEINLNWTLPNTMTELQKGNILPFIKHFLLILKSRIIFFFRKILFAFGL